MSEAIGAQKGERSEGRSGYRSGYYPRSLITRVGKLELTIPQDRQGRFSTEIFERYQRSEKALVAALTEMYIQGVSTRKVRAISEELCGHSSGASAISGFNKKLDEELGRFARRELVVPFCPGPAWSPGPSRRLVPRSLAARARWCFGSRWVPCCLAACRCLPVAPSCSRLSLRFPPVFSPASAPPVPRCCVPASRPGPRPALLRGRVRCPCGRPLCPARPPSPSRPAPAPPLPPSRLVRRPLRPRPPPALPPRFEDVPKDEEFREHTRPRVSCSASASSTSISWLKDRWRKSDDYPRRDHPGRCHQPRRQRFVRRGRRTIIRLGAMLPRPQTASVSAAAQLTDRPRRLTLPRWHKSRLSRSLVGPPLLGYVAE